MKTPKLIVTDLISILAVTVLSAFCGILIGLSDLPGSTKYSFTVLLLAGCAVVCVFLLNARERVLRQKSEEQLAKQQENIKEQLAEAEKTLAEKQKSFEKSVGEREKQLAEKERRMEEQRRKAAETIVLGQPVALQSTAEQLRQKCEAIEAFRNSFPYLISDGYLLYNIMRTEVSVSAYSRWQIVGEYGGQLWTLSILRPDSQSYKEMLSLVSATTEPQEIETLDMHTQLLWD